MIDIGFEPSGHWLLKNDQLVPELFRHGAQRNVLYAFVSDGEVKYVGKSVQPLHSRMAGYRKPGPSQTTNIKIHKRIKALLRSGAAVEILALPDNGLLHYGQFHLNLAAGLEDDIIRIIGPEWNGGERVQQPEQEASNADSTPPPTCSFTITLQPTYSRTGFFNVGVASAGRLGADGEKIDIFCGAAQQPIQGVINRTANKNGTPRIMGGTGLRDWFNEHVSVGQEITVSVMSPTTIRLEAHEA